MGSALARTGAKELSRPPGLEAQVTDVHTLLSDAHIVTHAHKLAGREPGKEAGSSRWRRRDRAPGHPPYRSEGGEAGSVCEGVGPRGSGRAVVEEVGGRLALHSSRPGLGLMSRAGSGQALLERASAFSLSACVAEATKAPDVQKATNSCSQAPASRRLVTEGWLVRSLPFKLVAIDLNFHSPPQPEASTEE